MCVVCAVQCVLCVQFSVCCECCTVCVVCAVQCVLCVQYSVCCVCSTVCVQYSMCCVYCADQLRMQYSVDTLKFVLFLYIQQVYRVSLRASLVAGEEYPCQCISHACL